MPKECAQGMSTILISKLFLSTKTKPCRDHVSCMKQTDSGTTLSVLLIFFFKDVLSL